MPRYDYINDETGEIREVIQSMNEKHIYIDENGKEWRRVFSIPQAAIDSCFANVDPYDPKSFVKKTSKGGTIGDLWDRAAELSEKRGGEKNDPIKNQYLTKGYGKSRSGAEHPSIKRKRAEEACKKVGISITPD